MSEPWERLQALFLDALEVPAHRRAAHVAAATDDPELRAEVLALLEEHESGGPFDDLAEDLRGVRGVAADPPPELPPRHRVGHYAILEKIAHGGMGSVYLAERADGQFEATVALKLLRRDIESDDLHRRFLAERQILARIHHPNIARLLDGGVTEEGRPYFVMEHVEGVPLDAYCDAQRLPLRDRLALFRTVCDAVEHAHRNLVVHRDLKPANILVTTEGTVKLLDFGIAKVLDPEAFPTDAGRTRTGVRLLTPEFASPEQLRGEPITTASDVYQLGLILHLLLTGRLPRLSGAAQSGTSTANGNTRLLERPSSAATAPRRTATAGSPAGTDPAEVAGARRTTPERLRRQLRGDLDNIVLLALREEPERRYGSVQQLSEDVRRHLEGLPVAARPERVGYLAAKFVRRNWVGVTASAVAALALLAFAVGTRLQAERAARERDHAQHVTGLLLDMFEAAGPTVARGDTLTVAEVLERGARGVRSGLAGDPRLQATMLSTIGAVYQDLGDWGSALSRAREAYQVRLAELGPDHRETIASLVQMSTLHAYAGALDSAATYGRWSLERAEDRLGARDLLTAQAAGAYGYALQQSGEIETARPLLERAIAIARSVPGDSARLELAINLNNLGWVFENQQQPDLALANVREALAIRSELLEPDHPRVLTSAGALGALLLRQGRLEEADSILTRQLAVVRRVYPAGHTAIAGALHSYALLLARKGEMDRADGYYREAVATYRRADGERSLSVAQSLNDFGLFLQFQRGDAPAAEPRFREAASIFAEKRGPRDPWTAIVTANLGVAIYSQGRYRDAAPVLARAIGALETGLSPTSPLLRIPLVHYGMVLTRLGDVDEAEPLLRRAIEISLAAGDTLQVGRAEVVLGIGRLESGALPEAEELLVRGRTALAGAPADPFLAAADQALVQLYGRQGRARDVDRGPGAAEGGVTPRRQP